MSTSLKRTSFLRFMASIAMATTLAGCDDDILVHQDGPYEQGLYEAGIREWMTWILGQPWSIGPVLDDDGSACAVGQSGPRWLLAGTTGGHVERECTIPAGKQLFFPLINYWAVMLAEEIDTPEERADALDFVTGYFAARRSSTCSLTLRVDGEDLLPDLETMDEELYAQVIEPTEAVFNADNFTGQPMYAGQIFFDAGGHWALLEPLAPGDHVVELGGARCNGEVILFETSATYTLHVEDDD